MNQPKFKIGDRVCPVSYHNPFIVESIYTNKKGSSYSGENALCVLEESLELYQEPQKKKLYAYRNEFGLIQWSESDFPKVKDRANDEILDRKPEYDLEYPSETE